MNPTLDTFLRLLRSSLHGTPLVSDDVRPATDWHILLRLAMQQTVTGLIGEAAVRLPSDVRPPDDVMARLRKGAYGTLMDNGLFNSTLVEVVEYYRRHGIEPVLLKGQGVARCYPNPDLRQCGDIDLYIAPGYYAEACRLAASLENPGEKMHQTMKHYQFRHGEVEIELHYVGAYASLAFGRWERGQLADPAHLRRVHMGGAEVCLPPAIYDAIFLFYHAWGHFVTGGIGLRQLCDWTLHLHAHGRDIDRRELGRLLKRFGLLKPWLIFGHIAVCHLGLPAEEMPFYSPTVGAKADKAFAYIIRGGNFGHNINAHEFHRQPKGFVLSKLFTLRALSRKFSRMVGFAPREVAGLYSHMLRIGAANAVRHFLPRRR